MCVGAQNPNRFRFLIYCSSEQYVNAFFQLNQVFVLESWPAEGLQTAWQSGVKAVSCRMPDSTSS
jgi:hypothetical protein